LMKTRKLMKVNRLMIFKVNLLKKETGP
jgi:hypothetical protein